MDRKNTNLESAILKDLSNKMSLKFENDYSANSILCNLYELNCVFYTSLEYRKNKSLFMKSENKFLYIKEKIIKCFISALFHKANAKIDTIDLESEDYNSVLSIQDNVHKDGSRTFGGRNTVQKIKKDSEDLRIATGKDIATIAYFLYKNNKYNIDYEKYIETSMILYSRNKMLYLYDL